MTAEEEFAEAAAIMSEVYHAEGRLRRLAHAYRYSGANCRERQTSAEALEKAADIVRRANAITSGVLP